ncbi:MAG: hypothetical protein R3B98_00140 [Hyphomonas sp.]
MMDSTTDREPPAPPKPRRHRRPQHRLDALRLIAREAAEAGESLASIRARLRLPKSTLNDWALADGFRGKDLAASAAVRAAARETDAEAAGAIRQQAEEAWDDIRPDGFRSGVEKQLALARARAGALIEKGLIDAAEEEMAGVRRLARLAAFAGPAAREIARHLMQGDEALESEARGLWLRAYFEAPGPAPGPLFAKTLRAGVNRFAEMTDEEIQPWLDAARAKRAEQGEEEDEAWDGEEEVSGGLRPRRYPPPAPAAFPPGGYRSAQPTLRLLARFLFLGSPVGGCGAFRARRTCFDFAQHERHEREPNQNVSLAESLALCGIKETKGCTLTVGA